MIFLLALPVTGHAQSVLEDILDPARLPYLKQSKHVQISSFDTTGGNNDRIALAPGETVTMAEIDGPGVITRIWITIDAPDPHFLRRILLRMYWDDEQHPSVEVPVGDFFGTGFGYHQYLSAFVGMSSGGYYSYFPMPFRRNARIEVVNETGLEVTAFYYHVNYQELDEPLDPGVAYFHAQWKRTPRTPLGESYVVLDAEGQGHFVGVNMSLQGYENNLYFLEGDEMIYVDGEAFPSIYGTGTEDYFTSGWYFNRGEYAGRYHGLILKNDSLARVAVYRFHVGDVIPFDESIRFTIEHGHANEVVADYSSTAYWYQMEPHKPFSPMPRASLRIPLRVQVPDGAIEAEFLADAVDGAKAEVVDMAPYGADWSDLEQLRVNAKQAGDTFTIDVPGGEDQRYSIGLYYTKGPDLGNVQVSYEGRPLGTLEGFAKVVVPGGRFELPPLDVVDGVIPLTFRVTGKDPQATGYALGLDAFLMEPDRKFIADWNVVGPFPNPMNGESDRRGLDTVYPPEQQINLDAEYTGAEGKPIRWWRQKIDGRGMLQLYNRFQPNERVVTYALTYVHSPDERTVPLLLGSDDGVKVFLNGDLLHRFLAVRISAPDQDRVALPLEEGWNALLIKVENNLGGYNFYARLRDPNGDLIVSPTREQ